MKSKKKKSVSLLTTFLQALMSNTYVWIAASVGLTIYSTLAIGSFDAHDPSWFYAATDHATIHNYAGVWGAQLAALAFYTLGKAAYLIPLMFGYTAFATWKQRTVNQEWDRLLALVTTPPLLAALIQTYHGTANASYTAGGVLGSLLYLQLSHSIGTWATYGLLLSIVFGQFLIITRLSIVTIGVWIIKLGTLLTALYQRILAPSVRIALTVIVSTLKVIAYLTNQLHRLWAGKDITESKLSVMEFEHPQPTFETVEQPLQEQEEPRTPASERIAVSFKKSALFTLPSLNLFNKNDKHTSNTVTDEHKHLVSLLQEKLGRFGVSGSVTAIKPGPVVTLFEYQPEIDTKLSKILALENDLALALEAMSVRIIAPIPGTSRVGFEVANKERKSVLMGDMVRSTLFGRNNYHLPIVLGSDTVGESVIIDLTDTPHLLVAGSTGSGKSVALNTLLLSILTKRTPDEVKLVIIDPKRLEFASYQDIPHLLFPIITQPSKAAPVLKWLVRAMEERYEQMAQAGVRTISDYHKRCVAHNAINDLPYIVVIIDELADLMMVAGKDVEESIARLAQMARAAGIHLVVATQRPSVDVITGVIKVNFPSRISFRVTSKVDSRTILDTTGAEHLLGKGDMLFMDAQSARIRRIHGAYVTDKEIASIVSTIKAQRAPTYIDLQEAITAYNHAAQEQEEPLLQEILTFLDAIDEVSISLLQRRFKIGYNRSARIIELLEQQGKIMPADGGKTRKIVR